MTPPVLLTSPTPLDTSPMDSAKRNVTRAPFPFGIAPPFAPAALNLDLDLDLDLDTVPPSTRTPSSNALYPDRPRDAAAYYDPAAVRAADASPGTQTHPHPHRALANARQWTGAPMRAVVPLPRRCTPMYASIVLDNDDEVEMGDGAPAPDRMRARTRTGTRAATGGKTPRARRRLARTTARFRDDTRIDEDDEDDEEGEWEPGTAGGEGGDGEVSSASRYCSYESITAAEGLAAWSFEELRVECYAQSLVARGTGPPPVTQPSLAIPPAFAPRIVPQN